MHDYHAFARETSSVVDVLLDKYLETADPHTQKLPRRRMGKNFRLRDVSIRLGYEISGGNDWQEVVPVCVAYELENCSSYVINWILDDKGEIASDRERKNLVIAGMQLRELAQQVLVEHRLEALISSIHEIQQQGYRGQYDDLNTLKVENVGQYPSLETFIDVYEKRCADLSGYFHAHCLFSGSIIANKASLPLYDAGMQFGSALQCSNDVGDFTPPSPGTQVMEKPYNDRFSDLRQGKLTLPVYLLLTNSPQDKAFVEQCVGKPSEGGIIAKRLVETGVFQRCYDYLRQKKNAVERHMRTNFEHTLARSTIIRMFSSITSNKFIYNLKKQKEQTDYAPS